MGLRVLPRAKYSARSGLKPVSGVLVLWAWLPASFGACIQLSFISLSVLVTGNGEHPETELGGTLSLSGPHQQVLKKNPLKVTVLRSPGVKFPCNLT